MNSSREHQILTDDERNVFRARLLYQMIKEDRKFWLKLRDYVRAEEYVPSFYREMLLSAVSNVSAHGLTCHVDHEKFILEDVMLPSQDFLANCLGHSGKEMKKMLTNKNLLELKLLEALNSITDGKNYEKLDALLTKYMYAKFFTQGLNNRDSMCTEYLEKSKDSLDKFFNNSKQAKVPECPNFFMMVDYLSQCDPAIVIFEFEDHLSYSKDRFISAHLFHAMERYVSLAADYSPPHFLAMLGDVDKIKDCLSLDNYKKYYDASKLSDEQLDCVYENISSLRDKIFDAVSCRYYAGKIFKNPEDIYNIYNFLKDEVFPKELFNDDSYQESNRYFSISMEKYILSSKKLMREIAMSRYRDDLYKFLPGIEQACKESIAYQSSALGLLTAKNSGEQPYINALPKDIIKKIAGHVDDAVKKDGETKIPKNKKYR